jgi:hypothetical protein
LDLSKGHELQDHYDNANNSLVGPDFPSLSLDGVDYLVGNEQPVYGSPPFPDSQQASGSPQGLRPESSASFETLQLPVFGGGATLLDSWQSPEIRSSETPLASFNNGDQDNSSALQMEGLGDNAYRTAGSQPSSVHSYHRSISHPSPLNERCRDPGNRAVNHSMLNVPATLIKELYVITTSKLSLLLT